MIFLSLLRKKKGRVILEFAIRVQTLFTCAPTSALAPFGFHFFLLLWTEITLFVDQYHIMMKRRRRSFGESESVTKTEYFISFVFEKRVFTSLSYIIWKL